MVFFNSLEERSGNFVFSFLLLIGKKFLSFGVKILKIGFEEDCCYRTVKIGEGFRKRLDLSSRIVFEIWFEVVFRRDI